MKLKQTIRTFGLASFLHDLGADMISPLWPLFLTNVMGASMTVVGFIDGLGDAIVSLSQAFSGYLSDRLRKRKIFIWIGYLMGGLARIGYAFAPAWQYLLPFRIIDRAGKVRDAPRDAIVAEVSERQTRASNFGIIRALDNLGAVCGIVLAILLFATLGYQKLFLLAAIPSVLAAILIATRIKEPPTTEQRLYKGISLRMISPDLRLFLITSGLFAIGSFSYSFLLIYAQRLGFALATLPLFYLLFNVVASLAAFPFGRLADRFGRKRILFISYLLWPASLLVLMNGSTITSLIASFALYGAHKGSIETVQRTFVSELAPPDYRASVLGGFQMTIGLAALPASFIAGLLWESVSIYGPFYFAIAASVGALALLPFVKEQ